MPVRTSTAGRNARPTMARQHPKPGNVSAVSSNTSLVQFSLRTEEALMSRIFRWVCLPALLLGLATGTTFGAPAGLDQTGKPDLKSAGSLAFGPKGVLFVGDPQGAQIFAIDVGMAPSNPIGPTFKLEGADAKIAALLGTKADDITINDVVVEPGTNIAYVSLMRGKGPTAEPAIVRVDGKGNLTTLPLDKVAYSKISISNAPADAPAPKGKAS